MAARTLAAASEELLADPVLESLERALLVSDRQAGDPERGGRSPLLQSPGTANGHYHIFGQ